MGETDREATTSEARGGWAQGWGVEDKQKVKVRGRSKGERGCLAGWGFVAAVLWWGIVVALYLVVREEPAGIQQWGEQVLIDLPTEVS